MDDRRATIRKALPLLALLWGISVVFSLAGQPVTKADHRAQHHLSEVWGHLRGQRSFPSASLVVAGLREDGYLVRLGGCRQALGKTKAPVEVWVDPQTTSHTLILHAADSPHYNLRLLGGSGASANSVVQAEQCPPVKRRGR